MSLCWQCAACSFGLGMLLVQLKKQLLVCQRDLCHRTWGQDLGGEWSKVHIAVWFGSWPNGWHSCVIEFCHRARLYHHWVSAVIRNWILHVACDRYIKYLCKWKKTVFHQFGRNWKSYLMVLNNLRENKRIVNHWKLQRGVDAIEVIFFGEKDVLWKSQPEVNEAVILSYAIEEKWDERSFQFLNFSCLMWSLS